MIHQRKICIRTFKKQCKLLRYALLGPSVCLSVTRQYCAETAKHMSSKTFVTIG